MKKFQPGKIAFYDDDRMLYFCYIGVDDKNMTLIASVYGKTPDYAISNAVAIATILNQNQYK